VHLSFIELRLRSEIGYELGGLQVQLKLQLVFVKAVLRVYSTLEIDDIQEA